jgi:hypothetical protein
MNTRNTTGYMLLFIGQDWHKGLSPEQSQKISEEWMAWFKRHLNSGTVTGGHPLAYEGKVVAGTNRTVTDGPFAEAKEAIGGYFMLNVATIDEAVAIARECPGLAYGIKVEVRPVLGECPLRAERKAEEQLVVAK